MKASAILALLGMLAVAGCATSTGAPPVRPTVARSSPGSAGPAINASSVQRAARRFVDAYLRVEVDQARSGDMAMLAAGATRAVAEQVTAPVRPTLSGFPPRASLVELSVLPVVVPGRWVVQARLDRDGPNEWLELQLQSSARGLLVYHFTSTTGAP